MLHSRFSLKHALCCVLALGVLGGDVYAQSAPTTPSQAPKGGASAEMLSEAQKFIDELGKEALGLLTDAKISEEARKTRFRTLFEKHFAVKDIGMFALGRYKNRAKDGQLAEYLRLYEDDITETYASRFGNYKGEKFKILASVPAGKDNAILVKTQILQPSGKTVSVKWKVYPKDGGFKIYDIFIEDVSMSAAQRDEFSQVLQNAGSPAQGLEPLLKRLREKTVLRGDLPGANNAPVANV